MRSRQVPGDSTRRYCCGEGANLPKLGEFLVYWLEEVVKPNLAMNRGGAYMCCISGCFD